jgi:hypothetical protein
MVIIGGNSAAFDQISLQCRLGRRVQRHQPTFLNFVLRITKPSAEMSWKWRLMASEIRSPVAASRPIKVL